MNSKLLATGVLVLSSSLGAAAVAHARPDLFKPALALYHDDLADNLDASVYVSLNGNSFGSAQAGTHEIGDCGTPAGGAFAIVFGTGMAPFIVGSLDLVAVPVWTERQVVVRVPASVGTASALRIRLCTASGRSARRRVEKWVYEHIDIPPSPENNGVPLSLATDQDGDVWVNEEFHTAVKRFDGDWTTFPLPQAPGPGIFAWQGQLGDVRAQFAVLGEQVVVDPLGRVWFTESGSTPYNGQQPNHSRILMYDPAIDQIRTLNVPGDANGVLGLAWDAARGRIWFTQSRRKAGTYFPVLGHRARLTAFNPLCIGSPVCDPSNPNYGTAVWDSTFDFDAAAAAWSCDGGSTSPPSLGTCTSAAGPTPRGCFTANDCVLTNVVCPNGPGYDYWCFREYEIPDDNGAVLVPAHVLAHSDGTIWYAAYWGGNHIGRLDPATGAFQQFPLPVPAGKAACDALSCGCSGGTGCPAKCCKYLLLGAGPWSVVEERRGDVALSYQTELSVGRFEYGRRDDPACLALDAGGQNPCLTNHPLPNVDPDTQNTHSALVDRKGNVWISKAENGVCSPDGGAVGYLQAQRDHVLMFPSISLFPFDEGGSCLPGHPTGMAQDPVTDGIWFADFLRRRLGRIYPQ